MRCTDDWWRKTDEMIRSKQWMKQRGKKRDKNEEKTKSHINKEMIILVKEVWEWFESDSSGMYRRIEFNEKEMKDKIETTWCILKMSDHEVIWRHQVIEGTSRRIPFLY